MTTGRPTLTFVLLLALAAIAASACGSGGTGTPQSATPKTDAIHIQVQNSAIVGGDSQTFTVKQGDTVTFVVDSDTPGALHIHGYNLEKDVSPGQETTLTFVAKDSGSFPVEYHLGNPPSETNALDIGRLNVEP